MLGLLKFVLNHPANKGQISAAAMRFFRWQLGSRVLGRQVVHDWIEGSRFFVRKGETGVTGNIYTGLHEFADMAFVLHFIRPEDLFADVGANVGSYTLLACAARGACGIAFEPLPQTYRRLVDNLRLNRLDDRVQAVNCGVGDEQGTIRFTSGEDTMNHALAPGESALASVEVEVSPLDRLLGGRAPALLKIDVEGYETPVLIGARATLANPDLKAVIMELNGSGRRYGFDESELMSMMIDFGFRTFTYEPVSRALVGLDGTNVKAGNTLFLRDENLVLERLRGAKTFELFGNSY